MVTSKRELSCSRADSMGPAFTAIPTRNIGVVEEEKPHDPRICGVKSKMVTAAALIVLLIIILTATIILIMVVANDRRALRNEGNHQEIAHSLVSIPESERISCPMKTREICQSTGCFYSEVDENSKPLSSPSVPRCFYPTHSYTLTSSSNIGNTTDFSLVPTHGNVSSDPLMEVSAYLDDSDPNSLLLSINRGKGRRRKRSATSPIYEIKYKTMFGFKITRQDETVFSLEDQNSLHVMKTFISITFSIPKRTKVFGLGNLKQLEKAFDDSVYTMWSRSREEGAHSFLLFLSESGLASGLYIDSSHPMDITLRSSHAINVLILSQDVNIRFYMGPKVSDVIKQYWSKIGHPGRPPYWGLGHFYGSDALASAADLETTLSRHNQLGSMPIEGLLLGEGINHASLPFSYDKVTRDLIGRWQTDNDLKFISTVPPAITTSSTGEVESSMESSGVEDQVFITREKDNEHPIQGMYDGKVAMYPDFTAPNTEQWWTRNITEFYRSGFGFYLDNNMPFSELSGAVGVCQSVDSGVHIAKLLSLDSLQENTLCLSGHSSAGSQLELHNRFALEQARITQRALKPWPVSKLPLVVSDATSPGIGRFAGHFIQSSSKGADGLKSALSEMIAYNFLGVTFVGPNICTRDVVSESECLRWYSLSIVSPLAWSISGNTPHIMSGNSSFSESIANILRFRQTLLPYHHDILYKAHVESLVPLRALQFDYPTDKMAAQLQDEVLFGDALLYTPILTPDAEYRTAYLPEGLWCNWMDGSCYQGPTELRVDHAPASAMFLRGGAAVVTQNSATTTAMSRQQKVRLIVVLDEGGRVDSTRFFDDGETSNSLDTQYYSLVKYTVTNNTLNVTFPHHGYRGGMMEEQYEKIIIYGLPRRVTSVSQITETNNMSIRGSCLSAGSTSFYKLIISHTNVDIKLGDPFILTWVY